MVFIFFRKMVIILTNLKNLSNRNRIFFFFSPSLHRVYISFVDFLYLKLIRRNLWTIIDSWIKTEPPMVLLTLALLFSILTTLASLAVPMFTKSLVDGFSMASLNPLQIGFLVAAFLALRLIWVTGKSPAWGLIAGYSRGTVSML